MPYTGPGDPSLPSNVKKMPDKKRRQWVAIFNSSLTRCQQGKLPPPPGGAGGKPPTCEGRAFAIANGTVKSLGQDVGLLMEIDDEVFELKEEVGGEKDDAPMLEVAPPPPFGGATNFDGVQAYLQARDVEWAVEDIWHAFKAIIRNIQNCDEEPATKGTMVQAAANQMARLMATPEESADKLGFREKVAEVGGKVWGFLTASDGAESEVLHEHGDHEHEEKAAVAEGPWDQAKEEKAVRRWASKDGSGAPETMNWGKYGSAFAVKRGAGDKFGDFGFMHHVIRDGSLVLHRGGVATAWAASQGARAGKPNPGAQAHLGPHRTALGMKQGSFFTFKDHEGVWRWLAVHSNKFKDRDGETLADAAHRKYVEKADQLGKYPEVRLWHVPGSRVGYAEMVDYCDGFVLSAGRFDPGMEEAAACLAEMADDLAVSHGFAYPVWAKKDGVVWEYWTFEVSPLPRTKEANVWTVFGAEATTKGESEMPLAPDKRAFLADVIGEEKTAKIEESLAHFSKELEEQGIDWKEVGQALQEPEPKPPEPKPEPEPEPEPDEGEGQPTIEERVEAMSTRMDVMGARLEEIGGQVGEIVTAVKGLQKSDDEKIAALMAPRKTAPDAGHQASTAGDNVLDEEQAKGITDDAEPPVNPVTPYIDQLKGLVGARQ